MQRAEGYFLREIAGNLRKLPLKCRGTLYRASM